MDLLQIALVLLIIILTIFLSITGVQVFLILRDLKRALDKLNGVLHTGGKIVDEVEKPIASASNIISAITKMVPRQKTISKPKFYKKILK